MKLFLPAREIREYSRITKVLIKGFLFFSSNRTNSFGGYDIFYLKYNSSGSEINNLGPTINNYNDLANLLNVVNPKQWFLEEWINYYNGF